MYYVIIFMSFNSFAARIPSKWRFEYHAGKTEARYTEKQPSILFTAEDITQKSAYQEFIFQYFIAPPWLDISLGTQVTGYQVDEPSQIAKQFTYLTQYANLGILLPFWDYWNVKLNYEYFYTTMIVGDDAFGFRNLTGQQFYPEIEWLPFGSDMFLQISPYFKFPLWSNSSNRKETTAGLKIRVPMGALHERSFPSYAYQKAIIIKAFYTNMKLEFEREGFITSEMEIQQYGITLGFNF